MPNNKLLLNIAGLSILINTSEDEAYTRGLAQELDSDITSVLQSNFGASATNAALLCALDYLDEAKKANKTANNMRTQIKEYLADAAKAKLQYDEEHKRAADLQSEIQALRNHLTRLATEGDASGLMENLRSDLAAAQKELADFKEKALRIAEANKSLSEKSDAQNEYIAGQDKQLAELRRTVAELQTQLQQQDTALQSANADSAAAHEEIERLSGELLGYQHLIEEAKAESAKRAAAYPEEVPQENFAPELPGDEIDNPRPALFDYDAAMQDAVAPAPASKTSDFAGADFGAGVQAPDDDAAPAEPVDENQITFESFAAAPAAPDAPIIEDLDDAGADKPQDPDLPDLSWTLDIQ